MDPFSIDLRICNRHLFLPVKNNSEKIVIQLLDAGHRVREFNIELDCTGTPDWWAFYDVSAFINQTLTLAITSRLVTPDEATWLANAIRLGDGLPDADDLYHERYRPQFHFTPRRGWNNDPNGLLYLNGEWHMYFQYNPFGIGWGNMHWGHAISRDLLHWQELPAALYQRSLQDMAFSGGGLVDEANHLSGRQANGPDMVLAFTSTGRGECLAYSTDGGRTHSEYAANPVIRHFGRDPKIIWYAPESKWVMIVYEEAQPNPAPEEQMYAIYDSPDLKAWTRRSHLSNLYECPELFSLPLDGDPANPRWVIHGSRQNLARSMCLIGSFDGQQFVPEFENEHAHHGPAFYASQVFTNAPNQRRIMIGWLAGAGYPAMPFSQGMTVPLELSLHTTPAGPRLRFYPARELENLRAGAPITGSDLSYAEVNVLLAEATSELLDLEITLEPDGPFTLDLRGHPLNVDPAQGRVEFAGSQGHLGAPTGQISLRILLDRAVTEIFVNQGEAAFAAMTLVDELTPLRLLGAGRVVSLLVYPLRSIWP